MLGLDPKMLAGMDPKMLASMGIDPARLDPKAMSGLAGLDPKALMDPKALAGLDPKMFGLDPKTMASLAAMDPKELAKLDPSLAAMYAGLMGMPSSSHNGVPKSSGASGSTVKAKPGTVAAALEAKKAAAQAEAASASKDTEAKNEAAK